MLRMRLQRRGKKGYATYRVVVADRSAPIKGRYVEDIGYYNPHTDEFSVDTSKATTWIDQGASPSSTVHNLLVSNGVIKAEKVTSWKPKKNEGEEEKQESQEASTPDSTESGDQKSEEEAEAGTEEK